MKKHSVTLFALLCGSLTLFAGYGKYCQSTTLTVRLPNPCANNQACSVSTQTSGTCEWVGYYCPTPGTGTQKIYSGVCDAFNGCHTPGTPASSSTFSCEC